MKLQRSNRIGHNNTKPNTRLYTNKVFKGQNLLLVQKARVYSKELLLEERQAIQYRTTLQGQYYYYWSRRI